MTYRELQEIVERIEDELRIQVADLPIPPADLVVKAWGAQARFPVYLSRAQWAWIAASIRGQQAASVGSDPQDAPGEAVEGPQKGVTRSG